MSYYTHTVKPVGNFVEKEHGNNFEYSLNDDAANNREDMLNVDIYDNVPSVGRLAPVTAFNKYPHKVWIGAVINDQGYRYAKVMKTVAYVVVDEDDDGQPVVEKWYIKNNKEYTV